MKFFKYLFQIIILIQLLIFNKLFNSNCKNINNLNQNNDFDKNFDYIHYENNWITEKMMNEAGWMMTLNEVYLINGLIRKHKPKNCLEIGVAFGGSSVLILNAIKDFPESNLVSIDLAKHINQKNIGYKVELFPELMKKWKLFTGNMAHTFLSHLNMKFDFLLLDSAHTSPGEFLNFIEALPFLNENPIIVLHDIKWHFYRATNTNKTLFKVKSMPTQIYLMSTLIGEKILIKKGINDLENIGVVCLSNKQENYYLNYFLLLMNIWENMPNNNQIHDLRVFINKYYNNELFLRIFDISVKYNRIYFKNLNECKYKLLDKKRGKGCF